MDDRRMTMNGHGPGCESFIDELKAYVDGELSMARKLSVRSHVSKCPACREEVTAMEQMGNELRMGDAGGLDAALKAKIMAGVPDSTPDSADSENPARRRWR